MKTKNIASIKMLYCKVSSSVSLINSVSRHLWKAISTKTGRNIDISYVTNLIDSGANLNSTNSNGFTPLMYILQHRQYYQKRASYYS